MPKKALISMKHSNTVRAVSRAGMLACIALALSACGGGGGASSSASGGATTGGSTTGTNATTNTNNNSAVSNSDSRLIGVVLDGYLVGAKVCLDSNANWTCDAGEPSTITTAGGKFNLDVAPLKYTDTYTMGVIAEVGPDVYDEDAGKTLKAQGQDGYVLGSWGGPKPILTAMNTLGLARLTTNGMNDVAEAFSVATLLKDNGMSASSDDYFDATSFFNDADRILAKRTGRTLAAALAVAQKQLKTKLPDLYGADSRGLGLRSANLLIQALQETRYPTDGTSESEAEQLTRFSTRIKAIIFSPEQERASRVIGKEVPAAQALTRWSEGLFDVSALGNSPRNYLRLQTNGDAGSLSSTAAQWFSGEWQPDTTYQSNGVKGYRIPYRFFSTELGDQEGSVSIAAPIVRINGNSLYQGFSADKTIPGRELRVIERDASGLPYAAVAGLYGIAGSFSEGQKLYQIRYKAQQSEFVLDQIATFFPSLFAFRSSPRTCYGGVCWSITKQPAGNIETDAGTIAFSTPSNGGVSQSLGEGKLVSEFVGDVSLLRVVYVPMEVQLRSSFWSTKEGRYPVFADFDNKLWTGRYTPANTVWYSNWLLTKETLNGILTAANLGSVTQ
jgi:hypothetical protein